MNLFQFQTVPNIIGGLGSIQELKTILSQHDYKKVLLVTDAGMIQHQLHLPILEILDQLSVETIVKLLYYSYRIRKKLEITHRLSCISFIMI